MATSEIRAESCNSKEEYLFLFVFFLLFWGGGENESGDLDLASMLPVLENSKTS